jgi:flagellar protein FlaJ
LDGSKDGEDDATVEPNVIRESTNPVNKTSRLPQTNKISHKQKIINSSRHLKTRFKLNGTSNSEKDYGQILFELARKIPFALLGERVKEKGDRYSSLQLQLKQARIPVSYEMYVSAGIFYSVVAGVFGALLGLLCAYLIVTVIGLPDQLTGIQINSSFVWLLAYRDIIVGFFIVIFLALVLGGITYVLFMFYPAFQAGERKNNIDQQLPYAVTFMYALTRGGMNILDVFKALAKAEDTYGEVAVEVDTIVKDMEYFGNDIRTALTNISSTTPSDRFQDLIYNLVTIIDSGGDIAKYFQDKSDQYLQKSMVDQKGFLETLALLSESYVTAFVAGPLFIIIMGIMMIIMGSGSKSMVYAIIYAVLPIGSLMFVVMISIITPGELGEPKLLKTNDTYDHGIPEVPLHLQPVYDEKGDVIDENEEKVQKRGYFESFIKSKKGLQYKKYIKNPLKPMLEKPEYTLVITGPIGVCIIIIPLLLNMNDGGLPSGIIDFIDDYLVFGFFAAVVPLTIFYEKKNRRKKKLEQNIPDLLKKLASTNETGMTLQDSIKLMSRKETDTLSKEIKKVWRDISWGVNINDSLIRFANRLRTQVVARSFTLITKANESSGDIGQVLLVASRDASSEQDMKRERSMSMMIYIVIIYIAFFVFVGVIYVISTTFLTEMASAGAKMASSGTQASFLSSFNLDEYTRLFKHACLIQGLSSGLMAGAMGEGKVLAGLKHSIVMMTIAYVIFTLFI